MWDIVCQLNVYRRTYKTSSPRGEELRQFSGVSFQFIALQRDLVFLHETGPCTRCCRAGRQRFSGHCTANSRLVARNWWWSFALHDLRVLARRCAKILVAPKPPNGVAGDRNGLGTTTRGPQPGLGLLGCGRCPGPDVPEFPFVILLPRMPGAEGFPRVRPPPPRPAICAADAPHEDLQVHPQTLPGRHSLNACTSYVPVEIWERALTASARAAAAGGPLEGWSGCVRSCGGCRYCRRCCCCCCRAAAAVPRSRGWPTVMP